MNRPPQFFLRLATLSVTAVASLMSADPRGFAAKVAERVRQSDRLPSWMHNQVIKRVSRRAPSKARELIDAGNLTEGVRHVAEQGLRASRGDVHLAKRTLEKIAQLEAPPRRGKKLVAKAEPRVLHVLTNSRPYTSSGYSVRTQHVLESQKRAGFKVRAVTRLGYPVLVGKLPRGFTQVVNGIHYSRMLPWVYPRSLQKRDDLAVKMIVREALDMQATALHTTTDYTNALVVSEAARILDIPWIYEVRGELESTWLSRQPTDKQSIAEHSEFYRLARAQETRCMKAASAVIALSEISKQQMVSRGVDIETITVVPNAVDEDLIGRRFDRDSIRRELGLPTDKKLVGSVTAVVDYEGLDTLVEALTRLPDDWEVLIVGDGTALPSLEAYAQALGVKARVRMVGRKPSDNIWKWYAALDVFAVPRKDTRVTRMVTPIKPLIAMALGVPVVASDLPALREVTGDTARYFRAGDVTELSGEIVAISSADAAVGIEKARSKIWRANAFEYARLFGLDLANR